MGAGGLTRGVEMCDNPRMRKSFISFGVSVGWRALGCLLLICFSMMATAVDLRSPADGRAWGILLQSDENLQWRWAEGATTATLSVSNLLTGVTAVSEPVVRGGSLDGACVIPATGTDTARLIDVTLVQSNGETDVETRTARLRIGPSSSDVMTDASHKSFREIREPRPFAWSDVWAGLDAETATLDVAAEDGTAIGTWTLPSASGWSVVRPKVELGSRHGKPTLLVRFDAETEAALTAELWYLNLGTMLRFR